MTKKEKAEFDAAILKAEILGALRWTQEVLPDIAPPTYEGYGFSAGKDGWSFNTYTESVFEAWSESNAHGFGKYANRSRMSGSRGGIALYSSSELALKGLRSAMETQYAKNLQKIDKAIRDAVESENQNKSGEPNVN